MSHASTLGTNRAVPVVVEPAKRCTKCRLLLLSGAFADDLTVKKPGALGDRQSWCRRCKDLWEYEPEHAWGRLVKDLGEKEPSSFMSPFGWTRETYLARWLAVGGRCEMCGAGLREWQKSGHNLDRISNSEPHVPGNCRFACKPCNFIKSNRSPYVADVEIARQVELHGRGRVPWNEYSNGRFRRRHPFDLSPWLVDDPQMGFAGEGW